LLRCTRNDIEGGTIERLCVHPELGGLCIVRRAKQPYTVVAINDTQ
jgi:hypothetical protein